MAAPPGTGFEGQGAQNTQAFARRAERRKRRWRTRNARYALHDEWTMAEVVERSRPQRH